MKKLIKNIAFNSSKGNSYICSPKNKKTSFVHPLIKYYYELELQNINAEEYISDIKEYPVAIDEKYKFSEQEVKYNYNKYLLLKENGFFDNARITSPR